MNELAKQETDNGSAVALPLSNAWLGEYDIAVVLLKKVVNDLRQENGALQAKIDRLMLEYCPDEMTEEQRENWGLDQRTSRLSP